MGVKELLIHDTGTGELFPPRSRKKKRKEGFYMTTQADAVCLAKMKLTGMEHSILLYLMGVMDYNNVAIISQAFLASELDTTEATISGCIGKLVDKSLINRVVVAGSKGFEVTKLLASRGTE